MMRKLATLAVAVSFAVVFLPSVAAATRQPRTRRARVVRPPALVWHVETLDGAILESNQGTEPINPASVVKVATTWWAMEKLGPDHRFETAFYARGRVDPDHGVLDGDLVVVGGGDPDFQPENAFLVASGLNQLGVRRVTGRLVVNGRFWSGWEGGSERIDSDPQRRALTMAGRLRRDLDPARWSGVTRAAWRRYAAKNAVPAAKAPKVVVLGGMGFEPDLEPQPSEPLVMHRSKPLAETIRRFNCFSNNDIERIGGAIGTPDELVTDLAARLADGAQGIQLATTSGLGENRFTPKQIVEMMRAFRASAERLGLGVESLLPVAGCDPGTVTRFFPRLSAGAYATALAGKTGTLTATDGGVSVIAGFLKTSEGELIFTVAAPRAAGRLRMARAAEERWLMDLIARHGGPRPRECAPPLAEPDEGVDLVLAPREPIQAAASGHGVAGAGIP